MKMILTIALFIGSFSGVVAQRANNANAVKGNGIASFYHPKFNGRKTATGEVFSNTNYTAASNKMPLNTYVKVTNLRNGRIVYVKINDRMAPSNGRMVDLTEQAAKDLGYRDSGTADVKMEVVSEAEGRSRVMAQRSTTGSRGNVL